MWRSGRHLRRATNQPGRAFVHLPPVKRSRYSRIAAVSPSATFGHKVGQSLAAMLVPHPAVPDLGNSDTSLSRMNLRGLLMFYILSQNLSYCPRSPAVRERFFWILAMRDGGARPYPRRGPGGRPFVFAAGSLWIHLPGLLPFIL